MLCTVHTTHGQGSIVFYCSHPSPCTCPGPVKCVWTITLEYIDVGAKLLAWSSEGYFWTRIVWSRFVTSIHSIRIRTAHWGGWGSLSWRGVSDLAEDVYPGGGLCPDRGGGEGGSFTETYNPPPPGQNDTLMWKNNVYHSIAISMVKSSLKCMIIVQDI